MKPDALLGGLLQTLNQILLGKPQLVKLSVACLLARGHLLLEDLPGVGKTTLAHALAKSVGLPFQRVQFTSDLLPADILGTNIYDLQTQAFRFHEGPIFTSLLLADEINRASPKAQSALLEAMEERQVTLDGTTRPLPNPFFVIATQNPTQQGGVFPLPESQLDRFLMRLSLGYPSREAEKQLLSERERRETLGELQAILSSGQLLAAQNVVSKIIVSPALIDYLLALVSNTRIHTGLKQGLSPRAGLALKRAAQAWAFLEGRPGVLPEDIQAVFTAVAAHRLVVGEREDAVRICEHLLKTTAIG
jgi:MoxR-like ATPase